MKHKVSWFAAIPAGIGWLGGILLYAAMLLWLPEPPVLSGLLVFLPAALLSAAAVLSEHGKLRTVGTALLSLFSIGIAAVGIPALLLFESVRTAFIPVENPARYERILRLRGYPDDPLVAAFPPEIPAGAEEITFRYRTPLLQGGEELTLSFTPPPGMLEELKARCEASDTGALLPDWHLVADTGEWGEEPDELWCFAAEPYRPGDWNHGEYSAAWVKDGRITFRMEDW